MPRSSFRLGGDVQLSQKLSPSRTNLARCLGGSHFRQSGQLNFLTFVAIDAGQTSLLRSRAIDRTSSKVTFVIFHETSFTDIPWTRFNVEIFICKARMIMKVLRSVLLASALLAVACGVMFAQNSTAPDLTHALVQAKTIYLVSGHVKYYKTKGFKTRLVEDSPFEEPSHKELEKWGRFQVVQDAKSADLVVRVYETGTMHPVPVGGVNAGTGVIILDVVHLASKKILWYSAKNAGLSWSTNTAVAGLFKNLREYVEGQESAARPATPATAPSALQPVTSKSEQH